MDARLSGAAEPHGWDVGISAPAVELQSSLWGEKNKFPHLHSPSAYQQQRSGADLSEYVTSGAPDWENKPEWKHVKLI